MTNSLFILVRIHHYEANIKGLRKHANYLAFIEAILSVILLIICCLNISKDYSYTKIALNTLLWTIIAVTNLTRSHKKCLLSIFLFKIFVWLGLSVVYYRDTFSLTYDPELLLLGLYFNGFYIIEYGINKNQAGDTEEEINDPEVPTVLSTPISETDRDRDSLPSYQESFNFPNSELKNDKNVDDRQ